MTSFKYTCCRMLIPGTLTGIMFLMQFSVKTSAAAERIVSGPEEALEIKNKIVPDSEMIVSGPDGSVKLKLEVIDGQLSYSVWFKNKPVIETSPIRMSLDNNAITLDAVIGKAAAYSLNETYSWYGVHAVASNHFNGAKIPVSQKKSGLQYVLDVRVFNDGASFRIIVPGTDHHRVPGETTVFRIPAGSAIWYHDLNMHYESVYVKKDISGVQKGEWVAPPATIKLSGGGYAAITEADLENYSGMALQADGRRGLIIRLADQQPISYPYKLRYSPEDTLRLRQPAEVSGVITTPWRVIMVGADLNAMVNNDIVHSLCPPPDKALFPEGIHTSWIKPGRAVWKYLDGGGEGTPEVAKKFSEGAARLGFEYNILEGYWSRWTDEQLKDVVDYSRKQGIGIWVWAHSRRLRNEKDRQAFFRRLHDFGIAGVKIDFFDHEAKEVIDLYQAILKETAGLQLMVDFHGANKPAGQARSWPNELVREAVKGMEASKLADRASHETTIPFTRFLAGPAEYTVLHFGDRRKNTTWSHQIASAAILSAPLLTYAASPEHLLSNPAAEMIKAIPPVWDETIVLSGSEIGEAAVFARRTGDIWFLAVMNGIRPKTLTIPLSFLGNESYQAEIIEDNPASPASVRTKSAVYKAADSIRLDLQEGGGYIAKFTRQTSF